MSQGGDNNAGAGTSEAVLDMPDEEFGKLSAPPEAAEQPAKTEEKPAEAAPSTPVERGEGGGTDAGKPAAEQGKDQQGGDSPSGSEAEEPKPQLVDPIAEEKEKAKSANGTAGKDKDQPAEQPKADDKTKAGEPGQEKKAAEPDPSGAAAPSPMSSMTSEQKVAVFDQIMKPFKANGKMIELRSPEEAVALMQMGANYTKKLQDLQPHRKVLMMLENNSLLDEGKLSFLIDLDRRDPEAIKKLLKDGGIDPLEIDTATEPAYVGGSHAVSDAEASFRTTLDELGSNPTGQETLRVINTSWDKASKQALWQAPGIMSVIHEQRESGVYDVIAAEVDRQRTLGVIPANTPFLEAYKGVGDEMAKMATSGQPGGQPGASPQADQPQGQPAGLGGQGDPNAGQPQVLGTKVGAPQSQVANGDQAKAASMTPTAPGKKAAEVVNPLAESDEAFLKRMENRL